MIITRSLKVLAYSTCLVLLGIFLSTYLFQTKSVAAQDNIYSLSQTEQIFADIYNQISPSVVSITVAGQREDESFFNESTGSGFVIDNQGSIVTNFHVVNGADRIEVNFFDGTIAEAELIGLDPDSDLAVIRALDVPAERFIPVRFADSDKLAVGQFTLAIGNPFQQDWTLTSGIISALNRSIIGLNNYSIGGVIQTDAAINPGNSGGPLLDLAGNVIGVNSQIRFGDTGARQNAGVGFAIPSNLVVRVTNEILLNGKMNYSYIGISSRPIDLDLIKAYGLPNNLRGVAVRQVVANSPAAQGGLQTIGMNSVDIVTGIDGFPIRNFDDLIGYLAINTSPGQTVNLTIYRDGQSLVLPVTLTKRP
ncbi:trypsin-like peptidase domain-containing protein [Anaerolineales bacterium]